MDIRILTDAVSEPLARTFDEHFRALGHTVDLRVRRQFPIADALPALLHTTASAQDLVVVVLTPESPHRDWVFSELRLAQLYPRVCLAVSSESELPSWASLDDPRVILPGQSVPHPFP